MMHCGQASALKLLKLVNHVLYGIVCTEGRAVARALIGGVGGGCV